MMDCLSADTRLRAFDKLAALSTSAPFSSNENRDFKRLCKATIQRKAASQSNGFLDGVLKGAASPSRVPMTFRELQVLLSLCKAAPSITEEEQANRLAAQLTAYLPEALTQPLRASPFLHEILPSPWEALSYHLTSALLVIGIEFTSLRESILDSLSTYLQNCFQIVSGVPPVPDQDGESSSDDDDEPEVAEVASIAVSIMGFLEAAATYAHFWNEEQRIGIVQKLREMLSERFLIAVEAASSTIRSSEGPHHGFRDWRRYARRYAANGRPLGAMLLQKGLMRFTGSCTTLFIIDAGTFQKQSVLDLYVFSDSPASLEGPDVDESMVEYLVDLITDEMRLLEDGSDYLQLSSAWQQRLAFSVKSQALIGFLCCMIVDEDIADSEVLFSWLEDTLANPVQMADDELANVVLKCMAIAAKTIPENASNLGRSILRFIVQGGSTTPILESAARCLAYILQILSQDAVITTLYSLGNVLSSTTGQEKTHPPYGVNGAMSARNSTPYNNQRTGSTISLSISGEEETSLVYGNVGRAIVTIATSCNDSKIIALSQSMLLQKIGRVSLIVDACIIEQAAILAAHGGQVELRALLKFCSRLNYDATRSGNHLIIDAVIKAFNYISLRLPKQSPLYRLYLRFLLEGIISKGDVRETDLHYEAEVELAAQEITHLLKPLALLVSRKEAELENAKDDEEISTLFREAWFNIAVHGITLQSPIGQNHAEELRLLAVNSPPLVAGDQTDQLEIDVDLNTVLRRGMSPPNTMTQRQRLVRIIQSSEADIRKLSYPKVIFLIATYIVETLRAESGDCAKVLIYVQDPSLKHSEMGNCMVAVAERVVGIFLERSLSAKHEEFSAPYIARQLAQIFARCCHRIEKVQQLAANSADRIVKQTPSALCQKSSLFALLELLSIMWSSCLEADLEEYNWRSTFTSARGKITVELSDDYALRQRTLNSFYRRAKEWVMIVIGIAPLDVKGLLQTYLSEYDDEGAYGHVSLGRSFALDMGSVIPIGDHRLRALDRHGECPINVSSDFIAQYTTRQEYRYAEALPDHDPDWLTFMHMNGSHKESSGKPAQITEDALSVLRELQRRIEQGRYVPIGEMRDVLRRAASLLCRSKKPQCAIVHHLVGIPFAIFTKQSIKLGISLWLGIIHENPRMEPRIVAEVAEQWEKSIKRRIGIFNESFGHIDPFYVKEEFAPSDTNLLHKRQQAIRNIIAPHSRILQFFQSHFNAIRLGSKHTHRTFIRVANTTLLGLMKTKSHPLTREFHFHVILFALRVLHSTVLLNKPTLWQLKDRILSAALGWFQQPLRWSYGGNRLQIKAETQLLQDVETALQTVSLEGSGSTASRKFLQARQDLLLLLLESERSRLLVWLYPLGNGQRSNMALSPVRPPSDTAVIPLTRTAWTQSPSLAIQLLSRFASQKLKTELRFLLLNFTDKAISVPDGLEILIGSELPPDVTFQLKYLLYWAPVDPMSAVTYFLPAYGNHPFVLQYAMRALESHSVDVTFFYVPQIVQALRYDVLDYVTRYIIETGKASQLFAHQIIWNMKANAYKDEDSQIPDDVKPKLDEVMDDLINSFSGKDRAFYEREFAFFNEITDISGKLRPYIKRNKPEKKQKIEEELRKIKVEVGVYLPSNPDGVVIGIDRKSGKPLQSHAKAPYMATFRIRKTIAGSNDNLQATDTISQTAHSESASTKDKGSYEIWQSAIFKVGDDCRQDVLALQMIAAFRGIFNHVGLDVYVYPYRVTATAPGCGVIDVLPNSISRDMLGREAVNGLYDYFVSKYGGEDSIKFQEARNNFVKSMAAYSVISYLLQFKDRHNGNIMVDDAGHILHIDFGFCFDIAPGGVKFERAPFKLTSEMVAVMGGSTDSQSFKWFEELCIKAFLASRQYTEKLEHVIVLMLDSGLPCFKPDTIKHFRERMVLEKSEREAAEFMKELVRKSHSSYSTKGYDQFQLLTNGIPY